MLLSSLFTSLFDADIAAKVSLVGFLLIVFSSIISGLVIGGVYIYQKRKEIMVNNMAMVMVIVPVAAAVVIMLVGRNIAAALGLSGIFVLVRFRSGPVDVKDLAYLFASICCGVLNGCGYIAYALIFVIIMVVVLFMLETAGWGRSAGNPMLLKIWVPESLNFQGIFDKILKKYTEDYQLLMVRTTDFGSNCELRYRLIPKNKMNQKALIDEIRVKNGNMNVVLIVAPEIVERSGR